MATADYKSNAQQQPYYATYTYDALGRLLRESTPFEQSGATVYDSIKVYDYDQIGDVTATRVLISLPGAADAWSETTYTYDCRGWPTDL